jgi:hypothetical protein
MRSNCRFRYRRPTGTYNGICTAVDVTEKCGYMNLSSIYLSQFLQTKTLYNLLNDIKDPQSARKRRNCEMADQRIAVPLPWQQ